MATDWAFFYLTRPLGLLAIGIAIALPFLFWRLILGSKYLQIGARPLVAGYASALLGLALLSFGSSYLQFTHSVEGGILQEAQRWAIIPGWTIYLAVLWLVFVLPAIGLLGVPIASYLARTGRLGVRTIIFVSVLSWLALTIAMWSFPSNQWHEIHRFESLQMILSEVAPGIIMVALPFLMAIFLACRGRIKVAERAT